MELTDREVIVLYNFLKYEWIPHEDEIQAVVKKISEMAHELDRKGNKTT